jgi:hypothetical protein
MSIVAKPCEFLTPPYEDYLNGMDFAEAIKNKIMETSFEDYRGIEQQIKVAVESTLSAECKNNRCDRNTWINCKSNCYTILHKIAEAELKSTAYMLRVLSNSVIKTEEDDKLNLELIMDEDSLTGKWENDKHHFNIINPSKPIRPPRPVLHLSSDKDCSKMYTDPDLYVECMSEQESFIGGNNNGRLIMGFGPSAAGKSTLGTTIINLMRKIDQHFPSLFINIDGGEYRKYSYTYQMVLKQIRVMNSAAGFANMTSSSIKKLALKIFDTSAIKREIEKYLMKQKENNVNISLYVPDTLISCSTFISSCMNKINDYIKITGDKDWIALMIYQHKTSNECPYNEKYKCRGTIVSGESRAICEGKKYSDRTWGDSYKYGNKFLNKGSKYSFRIHNIGAFNIEKYNLLEDLSESPIPITPDIGYFFEKNNIKYINGSLLEANDCKEIYEDNTKCGHEVEEQVLEEQVSEEQVVEEEDSSAGGRKHKKTKKRRRTKNKNKKIKQKTRRIKRAMRKKSKKNKMYA